MMCFVYQSNNNDVFFVLNLITTKDFTERYLLNDINSNEYSNLKWFNDLFNYRNFNENTEIKSLKSWNNMYTICNIENVIYHVI